MIKTMSKIIFAGFSVLFLAQSAFSMENGGLLTNDTKFANAEKDGSLKLDQKNGLNLWFRNPLSEDGSSYIAGEGSFQYEYNDAVEDSDKKLILYADLNLLKIVAKKELDSGDLTFSAGRFFNSDLTGIIFSQNADGVKIDANLSKAAISLYGAYTGLLNAKNITIIGDDTDLTDKEKTVYVTANKFVLGALTLSLPYFAANQSISVEGLAAISLESTKINRFWGTVELGGPIVAPVFYNISSTLGLSKSDEKDMEKANLSKASLSVYPDYKSMSISLNALYASGNQGGFKSFQGFTSGTAVNSLIEPEYSGVLTAGLSASIKPVENFLLYAGGDLVFDALSGDESEKIEQAGFQYNAGFNWSIVSDVLFCVDFVGYKGKEEHENTIGASKNQLKISAAIAF